MEEVVPAVSGFQTCENVILSSLRCKLEGIVSQARCPKQQCHIGQLLDESFLKEAPLSCWISAPSARDAFPSPLSTSD